ncbi:MAG: L,D-transpeptidase family protein [Bdellovibrio sp.]|nr:L,D-transpeptidase family protein [Bdellovibrio sp.]
MNLLRLNFFILTFFVFATYSEAQTEIVAPQDSSGVIKRPSEILNLSEEKLIQTNALLADKTSRQLYMMQNSNFSSGQTDSVFDIDIGKNDGNKTKRDDKKTPEGIYVLQQKKTPPEIPFQLYGTMAFTTNYPNVFDKFENKTGSGIWLHSVPDNVALNRGSKGCVVLRNDAIKKVEQHISLNKTLMIINNQIHWLTSDEHDKKKTEAMTWLNTWKDLWEKQDLQAYIDNYSDQFSDPNYNKISWLKHKESLKEKYKYVKVNLSAPNIFSLKDQYLFQFVQDYESDGHKDKGIKNLYVVQEKGKFKILREEWVAVND